MDYLSETPKNYILTPNGQPRGVTETRKGMMSRSELKVCRLLNRDIQMTHRRPTERRHCGRERPCPFVSCKYHLYLDVNPDTGSIKFNHPHKEVWELEETCALDVAAQGGVTLEIVGDALNVTRERVRQMEEESLGKIRHYFPESFRDA